MKTHVFPFVLRLLPCVVLALACPHARSEEPVLPAQVPEEEARNAISSGLAALREEVKSKHEPAVVHVIADIGRTNHLDKDRLKMLEVAGQGLLQEMASTHDEELRSQAETRIRGVAPKQMGKVIAGMNGSSFYWESALKLPAWRKILKELLTAEELKKWDKVVADRTAYRAHALAELLLLEERQVLDLSEDQIGRLQPLLEQAVIDYLPDAASMFSGVEETEQSLYMGFVKVLIMGIPEDKARAIIKPERWRDWQTSAGDYASEWSWITRRHDERLMEEKSAR